MIRALVKFKVNFRPHTRMPGAYVTNDFRPENFFLPNHVRNWSLHEGGGSLHANRSSAPSCKYIAIIELSRSETEILMS